MSSGRQKTVGTLWALGACLLILAIANVWIGRSKVAEYQATIDSLQSGSVTTGPEESSTHAIDHAQGRQAFYLGVEQSGWWLATAGFAVSGAGLAVVWAGERARNRHPETT